MIVIFAIAAVLLAPYIVLRVIAALMSLGDKIDELFDEAGWTALGVCAVILPIIAAYKLKVMMGVMKW